MGHIDFSEQIDQYFSDLWSVLRNVDQSELNQAMNVLLRAYDSGSDIYCFGNGGSAATASHMMNDFNKGISWNLHRKFRFHCLNDNIATVMAIANDIGYTEVFSGQMEGKLRSGDVVVAISGSGNSANVVKGVVYAKSCGCEIIGISGYDGGKLKELSDYHMHVPSFSMQIVEDIHMIFNHMMMTLFYRELKAREDHTKKTD